VSPRCNRKTLVGKEHGARQTLAYAAVCMVMEVARGLTGPITCVMDGENHTRTEGTFITGDHV
jgi:hypothetical protein